MRYWNMAPSREDPADGVLDICGEIVADDWLAGPDACVARDFRAALDRVKNVTVRINSPGGDVLAGAEIYSALREHSLNGKGDVTVVITAVAASAASVVAMAGDRVLMYPTSYMMIHNPWSIAIGDAKDMRKAARDLDVIREGLINAYRARTGKTRDELARMLDNETWMSAGTCIDEGFADGMVGENPEADRAAAEVRTRMSASMYRGKEAAARIVAAGTRPWQPKWAPPANTATVTVGRYVPSTSCGPWEEFNAAIAALNKRAEEREDDPEPEEDPEEKPEETEGEEPEEEPEEKPGETEGEDPEEAPEEDPEEKPEEETKKGTKASALRRARALRKCDLIAGTWKPLPGAENGR